MSNLSLASYQEENNLDIVFGTIWSHPSLLIKRELQTGLTVLKQSKNYLYFFCEITSLIFLLYYGRKQDGIYTCKFGVNLAEANIQFLNTISPLQTRKTNQQISVDSKYYKESFESVEDMMKTIFGKDFHPIHTYLVHNDKNHNES